MKLVFLTLFAVIAIAYSAPSESVEEDEAEVDNVSLDNSDSVSLEDSDDEGLNIEKRARRRKSKKKSSSSGCKDVKTTFKGSQKTDAVKAHNKYRGLEKAADEMKVKWNDGLASRAQQWADKCEWEHGLTKDCDGNPAGQNMWVKAGSRGYPSVDMHSVVKSWADEKSFYHYSTDKCQRGKMCGHYTQVVWAKSREVGCGAKQCKKLKVDGKTWTNAVIVVCDYSPAGNYKNKKPFTKGVSCSACEALTGGKTGWMCEDNLCNPCTRKTDGSKCKCGSSKCDNGGKFNSDLCTCDCPKGYFGGKCENKCECADNKKYKKACDKWKKTGNCDNAKYRNFMKANCPKTCGKCDMPDSCKK